MQLDVRPALLVWSVMSFPEQLRRAGQWKVRFAALTRPGKDDAAVSGCPETPPAFALAEKPMSSFALHFSIFLALRPYTIHRHHYMYSYMYTT